MIRGWLPSFHALVHAVLILTVIVGFSEIGLRVYDSTTGQVTRKSLYDRGYICKSWFAHHTLKPAHAFAVKRVGSPDRIKVQTSSFGTRGSEPAVPKPPGLFRILCLGDDQTFAPELDESETFCSLLQRELEQTAMPRVRVEVINAGVPDYCPLLSLLQWKHTLAALQPDMVILNFDMTDVNDDYRVRRYSTLSPDGEPLACAHPELEMPRVVQANKPEEMFLLPVVAKDLVRGLWAEHVVTEHARDIGSTNASTLWLEDNPPDWDVYIQQTLAPLAGCALQAGGRQIPFVVCIVPAPWQLSGEASADAREAMGVEKGRIYMSRRPFETVAEFCTRQRILCCDPSPDMTTIPQPEKLYLTQSPHFSRAGHAAYSAVLARFLRERQVGLWSNSTPESDESFRRQSPTAMREDELSER